MRVICRECGSFGRITKTNRMSRDYAVLYCQCGDAECGHSWVADLGFKHTLSPSAKSAEQLALDFVRALSPGGRQMVLSQLQLQGAH
jgi:uncharacterized protein YlbG (UPF0298 family)